MQSTDPEPLRAAILSREHAIVDRLETLVNIESGSYDPAGVDAVGDAVQALWEEIGFTAERRPLAGFGSQRTFSRSFGGRGRVMILGHLDTVWSKDGARDWRFSQEYGIAHGPGVGDIKGGLVMAHAAV